MDNSSDFQYVAFAFLLLYFGLLFYALKRYRSSEKLIDLIMLIIYLFVPFIGPIVFIVYLLSGSDSIFSSISKRLDQFQYTSRSRLTTKVESEAFSERDVSKRSSKGPIQRY